jgi:hypothetical protein
MRRVIAWFGAAARRVAAVADRVDAAQIIPMTTTDTCAHAA